MLREVVKIEHVFELFFVFLLPVLYDEIYCACSTQLVLLVVVSLYSLGIYSCSL